MNISGKVYCFLSKAERLMISQDYARNFICDFIIGKKQNINKQLELFND